MNNICEEAIDRVRRLADEEKYLELCFKYFVCPKCGDNLERSFVGDMDFRPAIYRYLYECKYCNWKDYHSV